MSTPIRSIPTPAPASASAATAIAQIKRDRESAASLLSLLQDELASLDSDPDNAADMSRALALCEVILRRAQDHRELDANLEAIQVAELAWKESLNP